ncbi:MAG: methyltransferase domain-containing protein [Clostridiales bacterium]|jgi:ubiquinone/menaquinone biosynthesis C-methylase UbiE|nr:methyltransferase domain-containing protein [Clostridiales bacterium]
MEKLSLKEGDIVADIGSGGGYYSLRFAEAVGKKGLVYAVDVEQKYLDYVIKKASGKQVNNICPVLASGGYLQLPDESVDLFFLRDTFHDILEPFDYFTNVYRATKPRGRVAVIDFLNNGRSKESRTGHCTDEKRIYEIMQECGFALANRYDFLHNKQSFNIFLK